MCKFKFLKSALIVWCVILDIAKCRILTCNYSPSSKNLRGISKFQPSDIDATLCTHLRYSVRFKRTSSAEFIAVDTASDFDNDFKKGLISRTMALKAINPNLKVIAGVFFGRENLEVYLEMAVNATQRKLFKKSALKFMQEHHFDGLDLNWEFNNKVSRSYRDKIYFVKILKAFKKTFKCFNYQLSITVDVETNNNCTLYHIPSIVNYVDYINIAAYGFFFWNYTQLTYDAPLSGQGKRNVMSVIKYWEKKGAPISKLVLGLPFFGNYIELSDAKQYELGSPIINKLNYFPYNKICKYERSWPYQWDIQRFISSLSSGNIMIIYDDFTTINIKVHYGNCINLGGYMIMNIEDDDFRGKCGLKYPLLKTVYNRLNDTPTLPFYSYGSTTFYCNKTYF